MVMNWYRKAQVDTRVRGYGGPAFDPRLYSDDYSRNDYLLYKQLYEDVQLELDNSRGQIVAKWGIEPSSLIWFQDSLNPSSYTSGLTVESAFS